MESESLNLLFQALSSKFDKFLQTFERYDQSVDSYVHAVKSHAQIAAELKLSRSKWREILSKPDDDLLNVYDMFDEKSDLDGDELNVYNLFEEMPHTKIRKYDEVYEVYQLYDEMPQREIKKFDEVYEVYQLFEEMPQNESKNSVQVLGEENSQSWIPVKTLFDYHIIEYQGSLHVDVASFEYVMFDEVLCQNLEEKGAGVVLYSCEMLPLPNNHHDLALVDYKIDKNILSSKGLMLKHRLDIVRGGVQVFGFRLQQFDLARDSIQVSDHELQKLVVGSMRHTMTCFTYPVSKLRGFLHHRKSQSPYMKREISAHKMMSTIISVLFSSSNLESDVLGGICEIYTRQKMEEFNGSNLTKIEARANTHQIHQNVELEVAELINPVDLRTFRDLELLLEHTNYTTHPKAMNIEWSVSMFEDSLSFFVAKKMQRYQSYNSPYQLTDIEEMIADYENNELLLADKKATNEGDRISDFKDVIIGGYHVLIMATLARNIEQEAMAILIVNIKKGAWKGAGLKSPCFVERSCQNLGDLGISTGAAMSILSIGMLFCKAMNKLTNHGLDCYFCDPTDVLEKSLYYLENINVLHDLWLKTTSKIKKPSNNNLNFLVLDSDGRMLAFYLNLLGYFSKYRIYWTLMVPRIVMELAMIAGNYLAFIYAGVMCIQDGYIELTVDVENSCSFYCVGVKHATVTKGCCNLLGYDHTSHIFQAGIAQVLGNRGRALLEFIENHYVLYFLVHTAELLDWDTEEELEIIWSMIGCKRHHGITDKAFELVLELQFFDLQNMYTIKNQGISDKTSRMLETLFNLVVGWEFIEGVRSITTTDAVDYLPGGAMAEHKRPLVLSFRALYVVTFEEKLLPSLTLIKGRFTNILHRFKLPCIFDANQKCAAFIADINVAYMRLVSFGSIGAKTTFIGSS